MQNHIQKRETKKLLEKSIFVASQQTFSIFMRKFLSHAPPRSGKYFHLHYLTHIFIYKFFFRPLRCFLFLFCCFHLFQPLNDFVFLSPTPTLSLTLSGCKLLFIHEQISFFTHYPTKLFRVFIFTHSWLLFDFSESFFFHEFSIKTNKIHGERC